MREAIGGSKLYIIAIVIIIMFASYLAFSINRSRVYNVKNEIIHSIERFNGNNTRARNSITNYLQDVGYRSTGTCEGGNGYKVNGASTSVDPSYCIEQVSVDNSGEISKSYYKVTVFFKLDIPILSNIFKFKVTGQTKSIFNPNNS